ncbi:MAG: hypothetical protein M3442_17570 [Chloroflexota bacterium]|nr:hypothetical protein [Chloroflexota bacterium]
MPASEPRRFTTAARDALLEQGWRLLDAPAGITLATLRAAGAPFKGSRYFDAQAARTVELPVPAGDIAYRPGLMPDSLNHTFEQGERLTRALVPLLPHGAEATIAPAALYVWLLQEHFRQHGEWPLRQCYTWTADRSRVHSQSTAEDASGRPQPRGNGASADASVEYVHLAVGVFGQQRPLLVSPIPEPSGRGLGVMPIIVPSPPSPSPEERGT